jgi:ABC-type glycerol-3-phosphate transport system substrate-binding protein
MHSPKLTPKLIFSILIILTLFALVGSACRSLQEKDPRLRPTATGAASVIKTGESVPATATPTLIAEVMGAKIADLEGVELVLWHAWDDKQASEGIQAVVDEFNTQNDWDIKVNVVGHESYLALEDAMEAAVQSDDLPDVVVGYANTLISWYGAEVIADLSPYLENEMVGLSDQAQADFFPEALQNVRMADGTMVGVPLQQTAMVLFYNRTWAQELGFESAPSHSQALKEQACAAAKAGHGNDEAGNHGTGGLALDPSPSHVMAWIFAYGGEVFDEEKGEYDFTTQPVVDAADFWKTLGEEECAFEMEGYLYPETFSDNVFSSRRALFAVGPTSTLVDHPEMFEGNNPEMDEWAAMPFLGEDGSRAVNTYITSLAVIDSTPAKKLASWLFVKDLLYPEKQADWVMYSDTYPVRRRAASKLERYQAENPAWALGWDLLEVGKTEPIAPSWRIVRWAVSDAFAGILQSSSGDVQDILEDLNDLSEELAGLEN